jgi:hypothetical protein
MSAMALPRADKNHVTMPAETIRPGDRVHDRDDPAPDDAIVVIRPPMTASEWEVESRDKTLTDDNPDYPDDAPVVVVCFVDDLLDYGPPFDPTEQTELSLSTLNESGVHYVTFPAPRLDVIESPATGLNGTEPPTADETEPPTSATPINGSPATDPAHATEQPVTDSEAASDENEETGPSPELQQVKTTLEANDLAVTVEETDTLTVERLGQTYSVCSDGSVDGDGALRSRLETIVQDAT